MRTVESQGCLLLTSSCLGEVYLGSADCMWNTHTRQGNRLHSTSANLNVNLIHKHLHQNIQNSIWPNILSMAQPSWHIKGAITLTQFLSFMWLTMCYFFCLSFLLGCDHLQSTPDLAWLLEVITCCTCLFNELIIRGEAWRKLKFILNIWPWEVPYYNTHWHHCFSLAVRKDLCRQAHSYLLPPGEGMERGSSWC